MRCSTSHTLSSVATLMLGSKSTERNETFATAVAAVGNIILYHVYDITRRCERSSAREAI